MQKNCFSHAFILLIFLMFMPLGASAFSEKKSSNPLSAYRAPNEDWHSKAEKHRALLAQDQNYSILENAINWDKADIVEQQTILKNTPVWPNYSVIQEQFMYLREHRFLKDPIDPTIKRSIPWRYVVDYCFERAAAAAGLYNGSALPRPAKVFAFGNLALLSPYAPGKEGLLTFWYHVAPVVRDRETNQVYVLDPSLNYDMPLPLSNWLGQLVERSSKKELRVNICNGYGLAPNHVCERATAVDEEYYTKDLVNRLPNEWDVLQAKGIYSQQSLNDHQALNLSAKLIYGSIDLEIPQYTALQDTVLVEFKTSQETTWHTLINAKAAREEMERFDYKLGKNTIPIGSIFAQPSRSTSCSCMYLSCSCALLSVTNKVELRVKVNDKVIKHCTYDYPKDRNLINYNYYAPDIHYRFKADNEGYIDTVKFTGSIERCIDKTA